jgi:hypothetical protein
MSDQHRRTRDMTLETRSSDFQPIKPAAPENTGSAERMRLLRERRSMGIRVVQVEVGDDVSDGLIAHGLISEEEADAHTPSARVNLGGAITALLQHLFGPKI